MACNKIYDEKGRVIAIVCSNGKDDEWEEMCKELEERTQREKENDNDNN